jgi:hypothetical protein
MSGNSDHRWLSRRGALTGVVLVGGDGGYVAIDSSTSTVKVSLTVRPSSVFPFSVVAVAGASLLIVIIVVVIFLLFLHFTLVCYLQAQNLGGVSQTQLSGAAYFQNCYSSSLNWYNAPNSCSKSWTFGAPSLPSSNGVQPMQPMVVREWLRHVARLLCVCHFLARLCSCRSPTRSIRHACYFVFQLP